MIFKPYECDFGVKRNGLTYDFLHVLSLAIEDPEMNRLTRGINAGNDEGISYKEGMREPKRWTISIAQMTPALKLMFDEVFASQERLEAYCIVRKDGSSKILRKAILCQIPQQLNLDDTPDSMAVQLIFESFNSSEVHKN